MSSSKTRILGQSWTYAAKLYQAELVPRFLPWTLTTLSTLPPGDQLPEGAIVVPCCGTGQ